MTPRAALEALRGHPRHLVLAALVAGLLLGPLSSAALLAALVILGAVGGRPGLALAAVLAALAGATLADLRLEATSGAAIRAVLGQPYQGSVVVLEPVRTRARGNRAARVRLLAGPARGEQAAARIPAGSGWPAPAGVGDVVAVTGRLDELARAETYQRRRGAHAAVAVGRAWSTGRRRGGIAGALDGARRRAERALSRGLDPPEAALARGMVLGQDEDLAEPVREEFRRSGLAHLLAASGQNVMLLAILVVALGTAAGLGLRARLALALVLVLLYVPLAGAGPSIQRAGVMGAAGLVAALAGRPASRWYAVGLAAAVTLALEPRAAGEPGWQLSFAAVIALLALAPGLRDWLARSGCPPALADAGAVTVAATLGTAPLMALHFEAVSLASLPANLLAAPAVAPVMWLGMLAAVAGQATSALASPLTALMAYPVAYVEWVAHVTAAPAPASLPVRLPGPVAVAGAYAALAALVLAGRALRDRLRGRDGLSRPLAAACVAALAGGVVAVGLALWPRPPARAPGELVVSFLEVGQGDATLLQRDDVAVLFDTGPPGGPVLARLREAGVEELDLLVLTHAQADHEGMTEAILRAHPARAILNGGDGRATDVQRALPGLAVAAGARVVRAQAGQELDLGGGLGFRVLWPPPLPPGASAAEGDPNLRAMVAHVRLGAFDLLLPADAESEAIAGLELPEVEALKVAHHGSADPGLPAQLAELRPRFAAIEVGARNTYGHPAPSTLAALRRVPEVARTDRDGTVRLRVLGARMRVEREHEG